MSRDLGDFQTPPALVQAVLERLAAEPWGPFARVLEPTCGLGHFIEGVLRSPVPPAEVIGVELQPQHLEAARGRVERLESPVPVRLHQADLFELDLGALSWQTEGPLLVVGNPPWVTNAALGALGSANRPARRKMAGLGGMAARTGASNFDLAEAVWLKLLEELAPERPVIALLCKQSVARRVLQLAAREGLGLEDVAIYGVDGQRWFGAQVSACLMVGRSGGPAVRRSGGPAVRAEIYASLTSPAPDRVIGLVGDELVADLEAYESVAELDGRCHLVWRQGVKHDAAGVMELRAEGEVWRNGLGEVVDVEPEVTFPLLKSTAVARDQWPPVRRVLVTQRDLSDDPTLHRRHAPGFWRYLEQHGERLDRRRSSIYRNRPRFSMFGVGEYTFASWKVVVSGLHAPALFRLVGPHDGRPVLVDDTCYLLACEGAVQAAVVAAAFSSAPCRELLGALTFEDAKRPITKRLLRRIDIRAVLARLEPEWVVEESAARLARFEVETDAATIRATIEGLTRAPVEENRGGTLPIDFG